MTRLGRSAGLPSLQTLPAPLTLPGVLHRSRSKIAWGGGAAAVLGGSLYLIGTLIHPQGPLRAIVPGSIVCMMLGAVGLYAVLHIHGARLERLGCGLIGIGLVLGLTGMASSTVSYWGWINANPVAPIINTGEHSGLVFIGAGMFVWGILAVRTSALGWWSATPIVIGLLGLSGIAIVAAPAFEALERSVLPLAFSASWIVLGIALLTRAGQHARPQRSLADSWARRGSPSPPPE